MLPERELALETRPFDIAYRIAGYSMATVALRDGCSKSTIAKTVRRYQETGSNKGRRRAGAPKATTPPDDAYLASSGSTTL